VDIQDIKKVHLQDAAFAQAAGHVGQEVAHSIISASLHHVEHSMVV
jgi:hypothetical protein